MPKEQAKIQECKKCGYTFSNYGITSLCDTCYNIKYSIKKLVKTTTEDEMSDKNKE